MRHRFLFSLGVSCFLSTMAVFAANTTKVALLGHVPSVVAKLTPVGSMASTNLLKLAIGLPLRNQEAMSILIDQLYDPSSPNYHKYLTPDQFVEQFGPTTNDYQAVIDFARANGLKIAKVHGNRMLLDVVGQVSDVEKSFGVKMHVYHHPTESRDFYAPASDPLVDSGVPVLHIQGLDNYSLPKSMIRKMPATSKPQFGSGPSGAYIGKDFRNAYVPGTKLDGSGQIVGLLQFDGYLPSDIASYESIAGLTNTPLQNVLLDGFDGSAGSENGEVCLDIEMVISMAPAISKIVLFEAGPFGNPDDILNSMASSNQIKQLSASWGFTTDPVSDQIFKEFALQGQTFVIASGDGDSFLGSIVGSAEDTNITIVGGTTLTMNGIAATYGSEQAWNWGFNFDFGHNVDGFSGTGGGISTDLAIPSWQKGISMAINHGSTTQRNVPDVALTADNVFVVSDGGQTGADGGTSAATPLWAGFIALVNQQAAAFRDAPVGFLAPSVYAIAKSSIYTNCFHDVTTGSNTWDQSLTNFFAVQGYDLCTGLGTPNGTNLINALAPTNTSSGNIITNYVAVITAPPAPYGTTLSNLNNGSPNGNWGLFIIDDNAFNPGMISNGWSITLTLANPVGTAADVYLTMIPSKTNVTAGSGLVYTLNVTNCSDLSTANNVIVQDTLPSGALVVSTNASVGSVTVNGQFVTWTVGNLATNGQSSASLALSVIPPSLTGPVTNYASVSSSTFDPNTDDNTATNIVNVVVPSVPHVAGSSQSKGTFTLNISGASSGTTIQASTNLVNWSTVYVNTNAVPYSYTVSNILSDRYRFFRVLVGP